MINANPLDPRYQAKIAQEIQRKNIEENMEAAIEYTPRELLSGSDALPRDQGERCGR